MPHAEQERLAELRSLNILDTKPQAAFDRITTLAAQLFNAPIALISFIDKDRQWLKSTYGVKDFIETPRELSFCTYTILSKAELVILDATQDERFKSNPFVKGDPYIRFYAGAPLVTQNGYSVGSLCIIDTKPRAQFTEKETRHLSSLAAIVIDEIMLHNKTREADLATQAKTDFLAHMAHEIRTPLNAILGGIEIFNRMGMLNEKQTKVFDTFEVASNNLRELVNNFLDLSKIQNSSFALFEGAFSYTTILRDVARLLNLQAEQKNLIFTNDSHAIENIEALGDPTRLRQIIINLVSNAIKYTHQGSIAMRAWIEKDKEGQENFIFEVKDTGIGIAKEDSSKIFESYEQLNAGDLGNMKGSGLGLAISRKLAKAMGGDINFTGKPLEGSVFTLKIPHRENITSERKINASAAE